MSTFRMELADAGIRGNGHMMLLEKNNAEGAQKSWLSAETRQRVLVHAVLSPRGSRRASSSCKWRVLPRGIAMASSRASCKTGAGMTRFRTLLAVCFTAMLAAPAWSGRSAGREGDEFAQLRARLRTNDAVRILLGDGSRVDGRVAEVTHQELVVTVDSAPRRLAATDITRVERRRNGVLMGALIGLGAGVPFGAAAGTYANNEAGNATGWFMMPVAIGVGAGIAIDAALVRPRTVFERDRTRRTSVMLTTGPRRASAVVVMTY